MISGTSRDGVDTALVSFENDSPAVERSICLPYPETLAHALKALIDSGKRPHPAQYESLHSELGHFFADGVNRLLQDAGIDPSVVTAVGSHGQTAWHEPPESIQLGDPGIIAAGTGITTVADFRRADLDAGGEGAPLAPLLHRALFKPDSEVTAVLNLGGIANITLLDASGGVRGFDTGPANCLMDGWIRRTRGLGFDKGGEWAAQGNVIEPLVMTLMEDAYFSRLPPKSTGVEYFNLRWLDGAVDLEAFAPEDIQATLCELTARSVAAAIPQEARNVLVCGGGVHNDNLLQRLRALRPGLDLRSTQSRGVDPDCVEAILFAWLARERLEGREQDTTSITGAVRPVLLGSIYRPA